MSGVNKVILVGRLGKDPDVRYRENGDAIANITLATSETWKDKNTGQKQEKTEWHRVVFFGNIAKVVAEYLQKGSNVYIEGKLQTRKWQDNNGNDKYTTEVVVQGFGGTMQMLDSRGGGGGGNDSGQQGQNAQRPAPQNQNQNFSQNQNQNQNNQQRPTQQNTQAGYGGRQQPSQPFEDEYDDDIPF